MRVRASVLIIVVLAAAAVLFAQVKIDSGTFGAIEARALGPATTSGRISAIAGDPKDSKVIYVGAASGGLWKTTNGGNTFKPVFDRYNQSIGAIAVDPSKSSTVWVGTGESWVRNSVSVGDGIYRSTDGGETWQFMGLPESERISKIVIDPKDSNTVYAAVPGKLWSASEERGLYKTTDGGKTWKKILYVDADTGCSDVDIDPQETQNIYAGMWSFRRQPWSMRSGGPGSGFYRSSDAGKTWQRVKEGMPEGEVGRISVAVSPARPSTVWTLIEAKKTALYRSDDAGHTWTSVTTDGAVKERPFYFSLLVPDPVDYKKVYKPGLFLSVSEDGGKSFTRKGRSALGVAYHSDTHALWIDRRDTSTLYLGTDGGVYKSLDAGANWIQLRNLPVAQFYHVSFDMAQPYNVFGGLQDNGSWMGPSQSPDGVQNKDWRNVGIGDGFYVFAPPADNNVLYSQYQSGRLLRFDKRTGEIKAIAPERRAGEPKLRFNWNAAVAMSPSDPNVLYLGGQFLFRSRDKGESWERISPDLTTNDPEKQKQEQSGGLTVENTSAENHCTIYTIAESPKDPRVIWVGTDDGNVQLTRDGGKTWKNLTANLTGVPKSTWVSSIEVSHFAPGTAYATFDGHAVGDMKTYVFRTIDFGATWQSLGSEALKGFAHVVREDLVNPRLLFLGTESGLFVSIDGEQWTQFTGNGNLPKVPVRDVAIHPRDHALVIATHGRGIYMVDDITPLRQITPDVLASELAVLESQPAPVRLPAATQSFPGSDEFVGQNPPEAAWITYYMKERHIVGDFTIDVYDAAGSHVTSLVAGKRRGINRVAWQMRMRAPRVPAVGNLAAGALSGPLAPEGQYTAKLVKDGKTYNVPIRLVGDPRSTHTEADRKLQQQTIMRLYAMIERLAYSSAAASELRDQARQRAGQAKGDQALAKQVEAFSAECEKFLNSIAAPREDNQFAAGEKLREFAASLYGDISRYGGRPTQSQIERSGVLAREADVAIAGFEQNAGKNLPDLNTALKKAGLQPLSMLTREEFDKRP